MLITFRDKGRGRMKRARFAEEGGEKNRKGKRMGRAVLYGAFVSKATTKRNFEYARESTPRGPAPTPILKSSVIASLSLRSGSIGSLSAPAKGVS